MCAQTLCFPKFCLAAERTQQSPIPRAWAKHYVETHNFITKTNRTHAPRIKNRRTSSGEKKLRQQTQINGCCLVLSLTSQSIFHQFSVSLETNHKNTYEKWVKGLKAKGPWRTKNYFKEKEELQWKLSNKHYALFSKKLQKIWSFKTSSWFREEKRRFQEVIVRQRQMVKSIWKKWEGN